MESKQLQNNRKRACWTCKDRKVRCDGYFPTCINCTRARRECVRSTIRLSWPRTRDVRRFIVNDISPPGVKVSGIYSDKSPSFLNTFYWDITLHMELDKKRISPAHFNAWSFNVPRHISQIPRTGPEGQALLSYFHNTVSRILAPFGADRGISHSLLRMAFTDETPASGAVLQAILALSSLKLYGNTEASPFKARAISMLSASLKKNMNLGEFLRCLAVSLLLSTYEIYSTADPSVDWTFFICGALKVAKAMLLPQILDDDEILLIDWLSCHSILARFSLLHWLQQKSCPYRSPCAEDPVLNDIYSLTPDKSRILSFLGCSLEFLDILSSIVSTVLLGNDSSLLSEAHARHLDSLELHLRLLRQHSDLPGLGSIEKSRMEQVAELYRLAGLIYLHRAARRTRNDFAPTKALIKEAFAVVEWLEWCEGPWPLFIIGCEARSDEQRLKILGIFSKTLQTRDNGNIRSIKKMVETAWVQDDLSEEGDINYLLRLNALISAHHILPTFI